VPGSDYISPTNNILIRHSQVIDGSLLSEQVIRVVGSQSGVHAGRLELADDSRTVIFTPRDPFRLGEQVTVEYGISSSAVFIAPISFDFAITSLDSESVPEFTFEELFLDLLGDEPGSEIPSEPVIGGPCDLPENYPVLSLSYSNDPEPGYIFMTPLQLPVTIQGPLLILDNLGNPVFYRQLPGGANDFTRQPDGRLTYFDSEHGRYYALDENYEIVDSFETGNGYRTNPHDLVVLPNGHALVMAYDRQRVRMDLIVPGGHPAALVTGLIVQEIDNDNTVVFQWRSWDHFDILDGEVSDAVDMTASRVDYAHGNALEIDHDGHILISSRHMNEITKINRQTGEIIWRLGPHAKNNEFVFPNDPKGFSHQHDVRRLHNGHLSIYDNGVFISPTYSRGVAYRVIATQNNKIAPMVWEYRHTPDIFGRVTGSVQHRKGAGTMICWGGRSNSDTKVTDLHPDRTVALEIDMPGNRRTYRALRYPWRTTLFTTDVEALEFGVIEPGDEAIQQLTVQNNAGEERDFTCIESTDPAFTVDSVLPFSLQPGESIVLNVRFSPPSEGDYSATLYVKSTAEQEIIAQDVELSGSSVAAAATSGALAVSGPVPSRFALYAGNPNPFAASTAIRFDLPVASQVSLEIFDLRGRRVQTLFEGSLPPGRHSQVWDSAGYQSGLYFSRIQTEEFVATRKLILMK
jgi:hypothetical protein